MSAQHTPGLWIPRGGGYTCADPALSEDRSEMMDWCSGVDCCAPFTENEYGGYACVEEQTVAKCYGRTLEESQANACVVAAAPELLDVLRRVYPYLLGAEREQARAAITKATVGH